MRRVAIAFLLAGSAALLACGCVGTGSPWVKQLRVAVYGVSADGLTEVIVPGAKVVVSTGGGTGGGGSASSQTLYTEPSGTALFRVEPGYTYSVAVTAQGYSAGQVSVTVGFFAGTTMTRKVVLALTGG